MARYPFEVSFEELQQDLDQYVDSVFATLGSEFLTLPRGQGFVDYPTFEAAYEELKKATGSFEQLSIEAVREVVLRCPLSLIVLRSMLGLTPPEWAYLASQRSEVSVTQGYVRSLDRKIRMDPVSPIANSNERLESLIECACSFLNQPLPEVEPDRIHRLDKADTKLGLESVRHLARLGVPYPMLLYERFLGRPFAGHRDSVSELVGGGLETAIEERLDARNVQFRKTKRAEQVPGFDQAPDFVVPDEFNPHVVVEAKFAEDDGTARDKVTRVQHLASLSERDQPAGRRKFEVIACIGGRGFGVRREDMKKLLLATRGKVFTLKTLDQLVDYSGLREFASE